MEEKKMELPPLQVYPYHLQKKKWILCYCYQRKVFLFRNHSVEYLFKVFFSLYLYVKKETGVSKLKIIIGITTISNITNLDTVVHTDCLLTYKENISTELHSIWKKTNMKRTSEKNFRPNMMQTIQLLRIPWEVIDEKNSYMSVWRKQKDKLKRVRFIFFTVQLCTVLEMIS